MTDSTQAPAQYPPADMSTTYADVIAHLSYTPQVVKLLWARFDASITPGPPAIPQVFAQTVLPMPGFLNAFAFFEAQIEAMLRDGAITDAQVAEARKIFAKNK